MPPIKKIRQNGIDYFSQTTDRRKLTLYLRNGNFKKIAGSRELSQTVRQLRIAFCVIGSAFLLIGLFYVFF